MADKAYVAFDLGASSGRVMLGKFNGETITLEEIHRFPNGPVPLFGRIHWDILRLHNELINGLRKVARDKTRDVVSVAADSWGVDFCLFGDNDTLLSNPVNYRDPGVTGMMEKVFENVPQREVFETTGIEFMPINSLYRLMDLKQSGFPLLDKARKMLLIGDTINYFMSGVAACEYSNATTSQMLDARTRKWAVSMIEKAGLPAEMLVPVVHPGTTLGPLADYVAGEVGLSGTDVVAVATHDTPSAIAAVPVTEQGDWAYLSSGTWSLMGVELAEPVITDASFKANFTNEGGVENTITFLKNIVGLWMVQELRAQWQKEGKDVDFTRMAEQASAAKPFYAYLDVDHEPFMEPGDMREKINEYLKSTGQPGTDDLGQLVRLVLEGLALKYRDVIRTIREVTDKNPERLHAVGGGIQNSVLNQFTADALGMPVVAGPVEATAMGNVMMQMKAAGDISSLEEGRRIVANSCRPEIFEPKDTAQWQQAEAELARIKKLRR